MNISWCIYIGIRNIDFGNNISKIGTQIYKAFTKSKVL